MTPQTDYILFFGHQDKQQYKGILTHLWEIAFWKYHILEIEHFWRFWERRGPGNLEDPFCF